MAYTSLSLAIFFLISLVTHNTLAIDDGYSSVVDKQFQSLSPRARSRFLKDDIKKGEHCDLDKGNICPGPPGIPAKNGTQLLTCCENHCRSTITDRNHCGACGNKCGFGQLCCNSVCTLVAYDLNNCGKCGNVCESGVRCEYGNCGYA